MAETFSIDTPGAVQASAGAEGQAVPVNVQPARANPAGFESASLDTRQNDATTNALLKLGSDLLAPKIKDAAEAQFLQGVQQVQDGAALKDVIEERPWYTEIFGPSSAVAGARAYSVQASVGKFAAEMENSMPKLAEQGPEAVTAAAQAKMKELRTGDPAADNRIMLSLTEQMAPLYKRHAKEHYVFLQNKASDEQVQSWIDLSGAYQQRAAAYARGDKTVTTADMEGIKGTLLSNLTPFADQTDASYEKNVARFASLSAERGNFQGVKLLADQGLLNKLPPEYQVQVDNALRAGANRALQTASPQFAVESQMILRDMLQNPAGVAGRVQAFNAKAAAVTGVPVEYGQMIPWGQVDNAVGSIMTHQATANAATTAAAQTQRVADSALATPGTAALYKANGLLNDKDVEQAVTRNFNLGNPAQAAAIANNLTVKSDALQAIISPIVNAEELTDAGGALMATYKGMNETAKRNAFTEPQRAVLDSALVMTAAGTPPKLAWQQAKMTVPDQFVALNPEDKKALSKSLAKVVEGNNESAILGWNKLNNASMAMLTGALAPEFARVKNTVRDTDLAAQRAYAGLTGDKAVGTVGEWAYLQAPGAKDNGALPAYFTTGGDSVGTEEAGKVFNSLVQDKAKNNGADLNDSTTIFRLPDANGVPMFIVNTFGEDGSNKSFYVNGAEVKDRARVKSTSLNPTAGGAVTQ